MHVFDIFVILTDTDVVTIKNIFKKSAFVTYYMYNVHCTYNTRITIYFKVI